jgi:hypothetical protein
VQRAVFNEGQNEELGGALFQLGVLAWDTHMWDCNSIPPETGIVPDPVVVTACLGEVVQAAGWCLSIVPPPPTSARSRLG